MQSGQRLDYGDVYGSWLAPLRGRFQRVTRNLVLATVHNADPFDDWTWVIANWTVLARAARDAGLAGILFDNEPYAERLWHWPDEVDYFQRLADGAGASLAGPRADDVALVRLDAAGQRRETRAEHGHAQLEQPGPGGLVAAEAQLRLQLGGGDPGPCSRSQGRRPGTSAPGRSW